MRQLVARKQVGEILGSKLLPAAVKAQERKNVGRKAFFFCHRGVDGIDLGGRPLHAVERHAVVRLVLRRAVLERQHVEHHNFGRFALQGLFQKVIGVPRQLLCRAANVGRDAVFLPKRGGRKALVHLAVAHKQYVMVGLFFKIIFGDQRTLTRLRHVLWHKQRLQKAKQHNGGKRDAHTADDRFFLHIISFHYQN